MFIGARITEHLLAHSAFRNWNWGMGMYPGIYSFNPLGLVFYIKNPVFFLSKVGFLMKLFIISYDKRYYTFEVASG